MKTDRKQEVKSLNDRISATLSRLGYESKGARFRNRDGIKLERVLHSFGNDAYQACSYGAFSTSKGNFNLRLSFGLKIPQLEEFFETIFPIDFKFDRYTLKTGQAFDCDWHVGSSRYDQQIPSFAHPNGDVSIPEMENYLDWKIEKIVEDLDAEFSAMIRRIPIYFWMLESRKASFCECSPILPYVLMQFFSNFGEHLLAIHAPEIRDKIVAPDIRTEIARLRLHVDSLLDSVAQDEIKSIKLDT